MRRRSNATGRRFYAWPLRVSADPSVVGTSPTGIARIIATVSGGALLTLPLPARDATGTIRLTEDAWDRLLDLLTQRLADWRIHAIANYESDHLLDPTSPAYQAPALTSADPAAVIPLDGWGVGHFAGDRRRLAGNGRPPLGPAARHVPGSRLLAVRAATGRVAAPRPRPK